MNINDFVILPGSKTGTSVRLKTKTVRELQLEKVQLETENKEMEKKLRQLQSNMSREKEERKKLSAYHWKSGQAGPMTIQARILSQSKENWKKVSSGKVKLQILKDQIQEPVKEQFNPEMENAVAHKNSEVERVASGLSQIKSVLLHESDDDLPAPRATGTLQCAASSRQVAGSIIEQLERRCGEPPSESTWTGPGNEDKGLLLTGSYNEEESAKSFQEALLRWRKGNSDHREQVPAREVPSESVGICEVQTNATVLEEPIHVEFKKDGLSYMEKLLLKKYRRTPGDQLSDSCMKDLKPVQTLSAHQAVTGGGGEGDDDDMDNLSVEEMKRFWASLFKVEESNTTSESAESESSLKIEFLDDSHSTDLEESSNYLVLETGAEGMNKQGKTEALEQCGRNPVSSQGISQGQMVACSPLEGNAGQKERIKPETLSSCEAPEEISNPAELKSNKHLETELQGAGEESQEVGSVCNSHSLGLPVIKKSSPLQDVARRHKSVSTWYRGLEGFFGAGANSRPGILEAPSSPCAASSPRDSSIPFPGDGRWVSERSLSEYAEDSVVRGVLERQLNRPSSGFRAQNKTSPQMGVWRSGPEKHSSSASEDGSSSSRHLEKICGDTTDFHQNLELKDQDTVDIFGAWDESQMDDEEEILEDKRQVLALH